jgi:hypothetical protein
MNTTVPESELRMLREALKANEHRDGFRSYVIVGPGTKGSNFATINLKKRAASLVSKGLFSETAHGYEVIEAGRAALNTSGTPNGEQQHG